MQFVEGKVHVVMVIVRGDCDHLVGFHRVASRAWLGAAGGLLARLPSRLPPLSPTLALQYSVYGARGQFPLKSSAMLQYPYWEFHRTQEQPQQYGTHAAQ